MAFLSPLEHFPESREVHRMAVHAMARNRGRRTFLTRHSEQWRAERGVKFPQVKTIAHMSSSREHGETREFCLAGGFTPLEILPRQSAPQNPEPQLVKVLRVG